LRIRSLTLLTGQNIAQAAIIIHEDFNGPSDPSGWTAHSYTGGTHTTTGTAQDASFRYPNPGTDGHLLLTQDLGYQHSTLIYTGGTLNTTKDFSFQADVKITSTSSGADGLAFFWMSKASVDNVIENNANVGSVADISGGYGEWQGVPHGNDPSQSIGYYEGISGYSFEFDHWKNDQNERQEYNHFIRIDDWDHNAGSEAAADRTNDGDFYFNNGWITVHFSYVDATETFSYHLETLDGITSTSITSFTISDLEAATGETGWYEKFSESYFGIGAATGGVRSEHLVGNVTVTAVPEPESVLSMAIAVAVFVFWRKRYH